MIDVSGVGTFIGCDAHSLTCSLRGYSERGKEVVRCDEVETEVEALRSALRKRLRRPVWLVVESGPMAGYVADAVEGVVDRVIVCETRENRWIAKSEDKSDPEDANRLARLLRMGECSAVYLPGRGDRELQALMRLSRKAVTDSTRAKNRVRDAFRRAGIRTKSPHLYDLEKREGYLREVKNAGLRFRLSVLYCKLDAAVATHEKVMERLCKTLSSRSIYGKLQTIPGIGPTLAAILITTIVDPHRFKTTRKLWRYAGLSVKNCWSGNIKNAKKGGSTSGNRLLKYAAMQAAKKAMLGKNAFSRRYGELIKAGKRPAMAQRTIARKILATVNAIWKSGKSYRSI